VPAIALKIVAAFVFEIWWITSDDMRVCNFLIISNTSFQSKERHICNGKTRKHIRATRGSAIAEEPRDALRQLKYYCRFYRATLC